MLRFGFLLAVEPRAHDKRMLGGFCFFARGTDLWIAIGKPSDQ